MFRYSYEGKPTVKEAEDDHLPSSAVRYSRPKFETKQPSRTRFSPNDDNEEDTYWTSSEADNDDRNRKPSQAYGPPQRRPQNDDGPIVASINRDKGAVIHITLNQVPAPKAAKNTEAQRPVVSSDEPVGPPAPPAAPPAPPAPVPAPAMPAGPSVPFFGLYGQQNFQQMMVSTYIF